jgi:hypothetical protein
VPAAQTLISVHLRGGYRQQLIHGYGIAGQLQITVKRNSRNIMALKASGWNRFNKGTIDSSGTVHYEGGIESAGPMARCITTTSSHRSNFQPTADIVPTCLKPSAACSPTEPVLAESPIRASI